MKSKLLSLQLYMVPYLIVFNMWGAPGYGTGTGIFYLSYLQFHKAIAIYSLIPDFYSFSKLMIFLGFLLLIYDVFLLLFSNNKSNNISISDIKNSINIRLRYFNQKFMANNNKPKKDRKNGRLNRMRNKGKEVSFFNIAFLIVLILIILLSMVNYEPIGNYVIVQDGQNFPLGMFKEYSGMNGSYSFNLTDSGRAVEIAPTGYSPPNTPMVFSRNLSGEDMNMDIQISPIDKNNYLFNNTVLELGDLKINLFKTLEIPSDSIYINPNATYNSTMSLTDLPYISRGKAIPDFYLGGNSVIYYNVNISNYVNRYSLIFHNNNNINGQNMVFLFYYNGLQVEFWSPPNQDNYFLSYNDPSLGTNWSTQYIYSSQSEYWNFVTFWITPESFVLNMNNLSPQAIKYNFKEYQTFSLFVGKYGTYSSSNFKYAMNGISTDLIISQQNFTLGSTEIIGSYLNEKLGEFVSVSSAFNNDNLILIKSGKNLQMISNDIRINTTVGLTSFSNEFPDLLTFGKITNSSIPMIFKITYLSLSSHSHRSYLINMFLLDSVLPLYVIIFAYKKFKKGK
ncbi:MAG: hypothetical protein ACP5U0_08875 [Caldisphaera sp.]